MMYLWVGIGGAIGSVARYWVDGVVSNHFGRTFPFGILTINATGSFIIGLLFALTAPEGRLLASPALRTFLMIGICGGYTTFSSFSLNTLTLARENQWLYAGLYVLASVIFCLVGVWLGYLAGGALNPKP